MLGRLSQCFLSLALGLLLRLLGFFSRHLLEGLFHFLLSAAGIELYFLAFSHFSYSRFITVSVSTDPSSGLAARTPRRRPLTGGTNALTVMFRRKRLIAHQARAFLTLIFAL